MSNEQNLRRFDRLTESERREMAAKAGRASGAARQRRKDMKELLEVALTMPSGNGDETNDEAIVAALIRAAREGDVKAFIAIRDTLGEQPVRKVEMGMCGNLYEDILGVK